MKIIIFFFTNFICIFLFLFNIAIGDDFEIPANLGQKNFDYKAIDYFLSSGQKGVLTAFKAEPEMHGSALQSSFYIVHNTFRAEWLIVNKTEEPLKLQILSLLDYKQMYFYLDGNWAKKHPLFLSPDQRKIVKIVLPEIDNGAHDFIIIAADVFNKELPEGPGQRHLFNHRANIFIGSRKFPKKDVQLVGSIPPIDNLKFSVWFDQNESVSLNSNPQPLKFSRTLSKHFLHVNNTLQTNLDFVLLAFRNIDQIPIMSAKNQDIVFFSIAGKQADSIPVSVDTKKFLNSDEFMLLFIENPFLNLESQQGVMVQLPTRVRVVSRNKVRFD